MVRWWWLAGLMVAAAGAAVPAARGGVIRAVGIEAFSEQSIFESFEGLTAGENIEAVELAPSPDGTPRDGFLSVIYGPANPFTFKSGISMTSREYPAEVLIGDFALGNATFPLLFGTGVHNSKDVPFGNAYIAQYSSLMGFSFSTPMRRVGLHFLMPGARLETFDGSGESLGIMDFPRTELADGELEVGALFIGIESDVAIESIAIWNPSHGRCGLCQAIAIDGLRADPVPEPGAVGMFVMGSFVFLMRRKGHSAPSVRMNTTPPRTKDGRS